MSDREVLVVLGLGSNVGDRLEMIERAAAAIALLPDVALLASSRVYESSAVGPPQADYLNAALLVRTRAPLEGLLDHTLAIETSLGRVRGVRWGPRTIDIDILWAEAPVATERLVVPHPHLDERTFALAPLLDVLADAPPRYHEHLRDRGGPPSVVASTLHALPK